MRSAWHVWTLVIACLLIGPRAAAQEAGSGSMDGRHRPLPLRQIFVPADDPTSWPAGEWVPVAREEFLDLLKSPARPAPSAAWLERVTYQARLSGTTLIAGKLEAVTRLRGEQPQFIDLASPTLAIARLHWSGREAVWGLADDGRSLLRVDQDAAVLTGRWSLAGRRVFSSVEFDVQVPSATVTQLELELRGNRELVVEGGLISRVTDSQRPGWKIWHIDLGRRTSCRLEVSPASAVSRTTARELQVAQSSTYSFVDDDLRIQTDITIQDVAGNFDTLELVAPPAMTFSSITAGNDVILPAWRKQDDQRSLLVMDVSAVTIAPATRLRLRGQFPLRPGTRQGLPRLGLRGATLLQLRRQVRVVSPLQLKDIELSDSRLVNASLGADSGAALEFDDLGPGGQIRVTVDTPQPELSATILSRVDWQQPDPQLRTDLNFEAQTGSTYSLVCDVPAGWEVTRVDAGTNTPVAQWRTTWDAVSERNQLFVEFRNSLSPQSPVRLSVLARPLSADIGESIEVPVVMPQVSGEREVVAVITHPVDVRFELPIDSDFQAIDLADLVADRPELGEEFTELGDLDLLILQATDPGNEQFLSVRGAEQDARSPVGPEGGGDGIATSDTPATDETIDLAEPIHAALDVATLVATERGQLCRNRVVLHVPPDSGSAPLRLKLPDGVRLTAVECRFPVSVANRDVIVNRPVAAEPVDVTLTYESPLDHSLLSGQALIPLPRWNGAPTTIAWQIQMPPELRLRFPTDGSTAVALPALSWSQRILGPLGRQPGESLFWPLSVSGWQALFDSPTETTADPENLQSLHRSLAGEREALVLAFWDVSLACTLGWVVLLSSLLIASWPFQQDRLLRPGWTMKLVLIGVAAALLSPEMLAIPWGGFVVGAAIGALLPEQWRAPRGREILSEASTPSTRTLLPLSATMGLLLASCLLAPVPCRAWQDVPDGAAELSSDSSTRLDVLIPINVASSDPEHLPDVVYVDRAAAQRVFGGRITPSPHYLLRSADYQIDDIETPRPKISAHFDAVVLRPDAETRVVLPLTAVQFPDSQLCQVDGVVAPLLPHRSGDGVVVVVPPRTVAQDAQEASVQIELVCQPRPATDEQSPHLAMGIPRIIASLLTISSTAPSASALEAVHAGSFIHRIDEGRWRVALGGQGHLIVHPAQEAPRLRWPTPVSADSVIEIHPMRLRIDSRLAFRTRPQWTRLDGRTLRLQLPEESILRDIRADGLLHTQTVRNGHSPVELDLLFAEGIAPDLNVEISFDLPASRIEQNTRVVIPPLPFLTDAESTEFPMHRIGVAAAPGFRLTDAAPGGKPPGSTGIDVNRLPAWRGLRTARTADATFQLSSARSLEIPLTPITPSVGTTVRQTLTVSASTVEWAATLQMSIRDAPLALHRLQVDPRVKVRFVSVTQDTVDRLASWSRTVPDSLVLFLKEELSGTQTVQLKGTLAVEDRYDFVIPSLSVEGASLMEPPEVVVQHAAATPVVVAADDGTVVAGESASPVTEGLVQLPTLNHDPTLPPLRIRRDRGESGLDIGQMTIVESRQQEVANWTRLIRVDASRLPEETLVVEVGATPPQIQMAASVPMAEEVSEGTTLLTLDLTSARTTAVDLTITGATPLPSGVLPEVRVAGSSLPQHLVVILDGVDVAVEGSGDIVDRTHLSQWNRDNLTVLERPAAHLLEMGAGPVQFAPPASADIWLQRLDSAVWLQAEGHRLGVTVADITALRPATVDFEFPSGMTLQFAAVNGRTILPAAPATFDIPAAQMPQRLVLWWSDETPTSDGLPLPTPSNLAGVATQAVLFGSDQQLTIFDDAVPKIPLPELLEELTSLESERTDASPVARALSAAGVDARAPADATRTSTTNAVQMTDVRDWNLIPVRLIDRQLASMLAVLLAASVILILWFVAGPWSDRLSALAGSVSGLPGLIMLAAVVWLQGLSWLGMALLVLLTGLWVAEIRRRPVADTGHPRRPAAG